MINSKYHLRQVGISEENFSLLLSKLKVQIKQDLQDNQMKKRGVKSKVMTTELKLLLTLTYLRHYPTFINLGNTFGISESYAHKIFHKTVSSIIK